LVQKGNIVTVICPNFDSRLKEKEYIDGIKIFRYKSISTGKLLLLRRPLYALRAYFNFKDYVKKSKFDVINFHSCLSAFGYSLFLRKFSGARIFTFHASISREVEAQSHVKEYSKFIPLKIILKILRKIESYNLKNTDKIITLSEFNKKELLKDFQKIENSKVAVIPGGVDTNIFRPCENKKLIRRRLGIPEDKFIFFTIRRLVARMGLENLINAFREINIKHPNTILIIGGDGFLRDKLVTLAQERNILNKIVFTGKISMEYLPLYYQASDLFILPTKQLEGFGLVILEALSSGLPVLSTPVGGAKEIIDKLGDGCLFKSSSSSDIVKGVNNYLDYHGACKRVMPIECRNFALCHYSWPQITEEISMLYKCLTNTR